MSGWSERPRVQSIKRALGRSLCLRTKLRSLQPSRALTLKNHHFSPFNPFLSPNRFHSFTKTSSLSHYPSKFPNPSKPNPNLSSIDWSLNWARSSAVGGWLLNSHLFSLKYNCLWLLLGSDLLQLLQTLIPPLTDLEPSSAAIQLTKRPSERPTKWPHNLTTYFCPLSIWPIPPTF